MEIFREPAPLPVLTNEQKHKISHLQQAIWKLNEAQNLVKLALGESDSTQITFNDIEEIKGDLQDDIDNIWCEAS